MGNSTNDSSGVDNWIPNTTNQCSISCFDLANTIIRANLVNWMFQPTNIMNLRAMSTKSAIGMGMFVFGLTIVIIPSPPNLLGFPQAQTTGHMSST